MAILCSNSRFLDELSLILQQELTLSGGTIELDKTTFNQSFVRKHCKFITQKDILLHNLNVAENIFEDCSRYEALHAKKTREYKTILNHIDSKIDFKMFPKVLSAEQKKLVEIMRAVYSKPKLLVARELIDILSAASFSHFVDIIKKLNCDGTTVLYLTNQWEEAVQLNCDVSVVVNGSIVGSFTAQEVRDDPSQIYYSSLCSNQQNNRNFEEEMSVFQCVKQSIRQISNGRNSKRTIETFTRYLMREISANSVVTFLINTKDQKYADIVTVSDEKNDDENRIAFLNSQARLTVLKYKDVVSFDDGGPQFVEHYEDQPDFARSLCYAVDVNSDVSLIVQTNFLSRNIDLEYNSLMITWVVQEMALFIENLQLVGNSLLLKESHHRIKNNLQVIVSLLEMEKMVLMGNQTDRNTTVKTREAFDSAVNRIKCIAGIHDILSKKNENANILDFSRIVANLSEFYRGRAKINMTFDAILVPYAKAVSVSLVINELISNGVKHNAANDQLQIDISAKLTADGRHVVIICRDNGTGFPDHAPDGYSSTGIGMMVIDSVVLDEMNGTVKKYNQNGAVVEIEIPTHSLLPVDLMMNNKNESVLSSKANYMN